MVENRNKNEIEFRILASNGKALLDHEVVGMLLRGVYDETNANKIAKKMIERFGGIGKMIGCDVDKLKTIEGVNDRTVATILCVKQTLERTLKGEIAKELPVMDSWEKIVDYLKVSIGCLSKENIKIMYFDSKHRMEEETHSVGTIHSAPFYIREIIEKAIDKKAKSILISHNHPSGDLKPSKRDIEATKVLDLVCTAIEIELIDHVIMSTNKYFSLRKSGLI